MPNAAEARAEHGRAVRLEREAAAGAGLHGATGKGLDQELQKLQNGEGKTDDGARPCNQKYELDWDKAEEIAPLEEHPTDNMGRRAASQRLIQIPVKKKRPPRQMSGRKNMATK